MKLLRYSCRKGRLRRSRGVAVVEATIALGSLVAIALLLFKASLSSTKMQRWTVIQGLTDAYMTRETAVAKRMAFGDLTDVNSRWPVYPTIAEESVEIGRLPGSLPVVATVRRTRVANSSTAGTASDNPAKMEIWTLQSLLSYETGGREYVKSRTIVRSR